MIITCTSVFKKDFEKLVKNDSYHSLESSLVDFLSVKDIKDLSGGKLLSANPNFPFLKDRIEGSGGYRIYLFLHYKTDKVVMGGIHPKTGPSGRKNTTSFERKTILSEIANGLRTGDLKNILIEEGKMCFQD